MKHLCFRGRAEAADGTAFLCGKVCASPSSRLVVGRLTHVLSVAIAPGMGVLPVVPLPSLLECSLVVLFLLLLLILLLPTCSFDLCQSSKKRKRGWETEAMSGALAPLWTQWPKMRTRNIASCLPQASPSGERTCSTTEQTMLWVVFLRRQQQKSCPSEWILLWERSLGKMAKHHPLKNKNTPKYQPTKSPANQKYFGFIICDMQGRHGRKVTFPPPPISCLGSTILRVCKMSNPRVTESTGKEYLCYFAHTWNWVRGPHATCHTVYTQKKLNQLLQLSFALLLFFVTWRIISWWP